MIGRVKHVAIPRRTLLRKIRLWSQRVKRPRTEIEMVRERLETTRKSINGINRKLKSQSK